MNDARTAEAWDALVEKAARAIATENWTIDHWREIAQHALAAVWPDLAEEKQRAIESALIFAAAHDDAPAARPVVDRDALAEALSYHLTEREFESGCTLQCGWDGDDRAEHLAEAVLPVVQAAADVRRAVAEETLHRAAQEMPSTYSVEAGFGRQWLYDNKARIAREIGERP